MKISKVINDLTLDVTKKWAKQRRAEERRASGEARRRQALIRSNRVTQKEAAWEIIRDAYMKASENGTYARMAHARQIMYAARDHIQRRTSDVLDDQYFCQTLLPDYLSEHPDETADWDVIFDARGHFTEPHTGLIVPLGTLDVREYLRDVETHAPGSDLATKLLKVLKDLQFPTLGPKHRFRAILFIEKEGFMPLFRAVKLAERYDIAIMSTKGLSVTASRYLVDMLCAQYGIPLLVLHDFDKSGFSIVGTLRRDTRRYTFANAIQVIDLGLRLSDVRANGLAAEQVNYGRSNPRPNLRENGATAEEIAFLCQGSTLQRYCGLRVELNAFTSGNLIACIESKFEEHGITKVIPDAQTLAGAYHRAVEIDLLKQRIHEIAEQVHAEAQRAQIPPELLERIATRLKEEPAMPWDDAIAELVAGQL
jgi:hypothetical protein